MKYTIIICGLLITCGLFAEPMTTSYPMDGIYESTEVVYFDGVEIPIEDQVPLSRIGINSETGVVGFLFDADENGTFDEDEMRSFPLIFGVQQYLWFTGSEGKDVVIFTYYTEYNSYVWTRYTEGHTSQTYYKFLKQW